MSVLEPITDWVESTDREPAPGRLVYECVSAGGVLPCERGFAPNGQPAWGHQGIRVHGVERWRVISTDWGLSTRLESV
jgi:hypothetical protein